MALTYEEMRRRNNIASYKYKQRNREKVALAHKNWYLKNRDNILVQTREKYDPIKVYGRKLKRTYGITLEDYYKMTDEQDGLCKICKIKPEKLYVDHCHDTGIVRGLLCNQCNAGIAMLKHNPENLKEAIKYLGGY